MYVFSNEKKIMFFGYFFAPSYFFLYASIASCIPAHLLPCLTSFLFTRFLIILALHSFWNFVIYTLRMPYLPYFFYLLLFFSSPPWTFHSIFYNPLHWLVRLLVCLTVGRTVTLFYFLAFGSL